VNQLSTALVMFLVSMLPDLWNETSRNVSRTLVTDSPGRGLLPCGLSRRYPRLV
jgi:hypothetical protein